MSFSYKISDLLSQEDTFSYIMANCDIVSENETAKILLKNICEYLPKIERFQEEEDLEYWNLDINQTDDEGIEVMIYHEILDLITLIMEDDDDYDQDDIEEAFGVDAYYTDSYQIFLDEPINGEMLLAELRMWEIDSNLHEYAIEHLTAVLTKGYRLSPFGGRKDIEVELSFDEDEIFVSCIDEEFDSSLSANPDYNLAHFDFDPENEEQSLELGVQSWTEFAEEDDSWEDDDLDDESWNDDDSEEDDDWDLEEEDEWVPEIDEDDE